MNKNIIFRGTLTVSLVLTLCVSVLLAWVPGKLIIIHSNDLHGGIAEQDAVFMNPEFPPKLAGISAHSTLIKETREEAERNGDAVLVMDAGDWFQGAPEGSFFDGVSVIECFNTIGLDVIVPGNHDFDRGKENLEKLIDMAKFDVVGANIIDKNTGAVWHKVKPWVIKEFGDLKVGIIGVITSDMKKLSFPKHIEGMDFPPADTVVPGYVSELKAMGVDVIIVLSHMGVDDDKKLGTYKGIDLIVGGHWHMALIPPLYDPRCHTLITQCYANGTGAGVFTLEIDKETKKIKDWDSTIVTFFSDNIEKEKITREVVEKYAGPVRKQLGEVIGHAEREITRTYFAESALGNFITDAIKWKMDVEIAFQNSGGIRKDVPEGPITLRSIYEVEPFGNKMLRLKLSGKDLVELLEFCMSKAGTWQLSGAKTWYCRELPPGRRIIRTEYNGELLDPDRDYIISVSNYLYERDDDGGEILRRGGKEVLYTDNVLRDIIIEYIRLNTPVSARVEGRINRIELAQVKQIKQMK